MSLFKTACPVCKFILFLVLNFEIDNFLLWKRECDEMFTLHSINMSAQWEGPEQPHHSDSMSHVILRRVQCDQI
jgi:hypothetical protein